MTFRSLIRTSRSRSTPDWCVRCNWKTVEFITSRSQQRCAKRSTSKIVFLPARYKIVGANAADNYIDCNVGTGHDEDNFIHVGQGFDTNSSPSYLRINFLHSTPRHSIGPLKSREPPVPNGKRFGVASQPARLRASS